MPPAASDSARRLAPALHQSLESGAALIVPSRQRAAAVRLAYVASQLERAHLAWTTPDVAAFGAWLEREAYQAAQSGASIPRPLRSAEEWLLWRRAAAEATPVGSWAASDRLAQSLRRAAHSMAQWRIPRSVLQASATPEAQLLARALEQVEAHCRSSGASASYELGALLASWRPARAVVFAGFGALTAQQRALLECWQEWGRPHEPAAEPARGSAHLASARDPSEELELAAEWCRSRLAANAHARLLVLIPDLAARRDEVRRVFGRALDPQGVLSETGSCAATAPALALEGGEPLGRYPLVRHALTTLTFLSGTLEFEAFSDWLRGSFWQIPNPCERAQLDIWLRGLLPVELSAVDLTAALTQARASLSHPAQALEAQLSAAAQALGPTGQQAPLAQWARRFDAALRAIGWLGARPLSSAEQQTGARFAEVLAEFASLGVTLGSVSVREALELLESLAMRTPFAQETGDTAVTLSGALADPIVRYDGIWVTGMHADAWPPPPAVDPFIPLTAQHRAGIPRATSRGMLEHARGLLGQWRSATSELVLSWPTAAEDRPMSPAPLLAELRDAEVLLTMRRGRSLAQRIREARRIEQIEDATGDPWPVHAPLPGGARALEYQSRCPFRAYAQLRLSCAPLEAPRPGIDPRERGRLLHRALELLWGRLQDRNALEAALRNGTLRGLIEECVSQAALGLWNPLRSGERREQRRAERLLLQLATLERERPPFRVSALELRRRLELAGAALDLRIDRIDTLEDGSRAIFDYKGGRAATPDWLQERISDPQLPAYLLAEGDDVVALATVHLSEERIAYRGLADRTGRLPQLGPGSIVGGRLNGADRRAAWQAQVARWRAALERLADDFLQGRAAVDPLEHACRICHLQALCRIGEMKDASASDAELP